MSGTPTQLHVEHEEAPTNVVPERPRFSWRVATDERGATQTAYRVLVARSEDALTTDPVRGDLWDSGRVESDRSTGVPYAGPPLDPDASYHWTVRIWNGAGDPSEWAGVSSFATALGDAGDWDGEWIGHQPGPGDTNGFASRWRPADSTETTQSRAEWVQVDLGDLRSVSTIELHPAAPYDGPDTPDGFTFTPFYADVDVAAHPIDPSDTAGFGFPNRYRIEGSTDPAFTDSVTLVDRTDEVQPNPGGEEVVHEVDASVRYVRVIATAPYTFDPGSFTLFTRPQLDPEFLDEEMRTWQTFALAALAVRDAEGTDLAVGADVTASSSRETGGWGREHLVDGVYESQLAATSPLLRTTVELSTPVKRARVHVAALGYGELYVNGDRVGDAVLDPGWTDYDERVLYTTHDLTDRLHEGTNAIGLWLGIGRFARTFYNATGHGSPRALVHLTVEYTDGTTRTVASGPDWTATDSPVRANDIYDGERYDARRERSLDGWATPGFDDADWADAAPMPAPGGQLSPQRVEPIRVTETFDVQIVDETEGGATGEPGVTLDVGQNLVGWVELELEDAAAGDEVELAYAEALDEENAPLTTDLGAAEATDAYVARGDGPETYEPRFTYHGFRYVRVTGYSGSLDPSDVTAKAVHTDFEPTGSFDCSNEELVRVQHAAEWSLRGNAHSLPTDCPQRAERFGWTGDGHISARAFCYNFDARRFHEKWQRDHDDCQSPHGYVADTIPFGIGTRPADPTWSVTRILIPWFLYRHYGDERVLERHYEAMRRYVDYWHAQADNGVIPRKYGHYGDWLTFEHRDDLDERRGQPFELFNTAYHYHTLDVFAQIADVLGQSADADRYRKFAEETRAAFNDAFFDPDVGQYEPRIQAAQAVALFFGLVPDRQSTRVVENLVEEIHEDGDRLMTGFLGTRPLIHTLADHGYADLAYRLVSQPERPGWVYMTRQGATTLWERWDSDDQVGSGMNSFNHSPFTLVSEWFYEQLAGLRFDPDGLAVAPSVVEGLEWVDASVDTAEGPFAARWDRTDRGITLLVTIPWNREATIHLPGSAADIVSVTDASGAYILDGRTVPDTLPDGVESVILDSSVRLQVSAGNYELRIDAGAD